MSESQNPFNEYSDIGYDKPQQKKRKPEKRLFWIKLKESFFDDKHIRMIRALPNGYRILCIYLAMQLKALKTDGLISYERLLPNFADELSYLLNEKSEAISEAIDVLKRFELIELWDDDKLLMAAHQEIIESGSEGASAERMRRHREKLKSDSSHSDGNSDD
jgi:predicted phage replisome organizer